MKINEMRLSLVEVESHADQLRSFAPLSIPFRFVLDSGLYQEEFTRALNEQGFARAPWGSGYGRRFWTCYNEKSSPTPKDLWESLVPFQLAAEAKVTAPGLKGSARARAYLYPWGIAAMLDLGIREPIDIEQAVTHSISIRRNDQMEMTFNATIEKGSASALLTAVRHDVRELAYGPGTAEGTCTDRFSIVTVLDGEGAPTDQAVTENSALHKQLNGFARGIPNWKTVPPDPLAGNAIATRPASPGSILFGTRRGRAVWFPESFTSAGPDFKNSLRCYHQNLTMATLHTEALCVLGKNAAAWLAAGTAHIAWPVNYDRCARNAAGLLGRLNGGRKAGTYGSRSMQHQIKKTYEADVNTLRQEYGMAALS
jgi:hypothetical protein